MADYQSVSLTEPKEIPLRARVSFNKFGVKLAGRVVGISHDRPMRYDLRLDNGALVANVPESDIDSVMAALASTAQVAPSGQALVALLSAKSSEGPPSLVHVLRSRRRQARPAALRTGAQ